MQGFADATSPQDYAPRSPSEHLAHYAHPSWEEEQELAFSYATAVASSHLVDSPRSPPELSTEHPPTPQYTGEDEQPDPLNLATPPTPLASKSAWITDEQATDVKPQVRESHYDSFHRTLSELEDSRRQTRLHYAVRRLAETSDFASTDSEGHHLSGTTRRGVRYRSASTQDLPPLPRFADRCPGSSSESSCSHNVRMPMPGRLAPDQSKHMRSAGPSPSTPGYSGTSYQPPSFSSRPSRSRPDSESSTATLRLNNTTGGPPIRSERRALLFPEWTEQDLRPVLASSSVTTATSDRPSEQSESDRTQPALAAKRARLDDTRMQKQPGRRKELLSFDPALIGDLYTYVGFMLDTPIHPRWSYEVLQDDWNILSQLLDQPQVDIKSILAPQFLEMLQFEPLRFHDNRWRLPHLPTLRATYSSSVPYTSSPPSVTEGISNFDQPKWLAAAEFVYSGSEMGGGVGGRVGAEDLRVLEQAPGWERLVFHYIVELGKVWEERTKFEVMASSETVESALRDKDVAYEMRKATERATGAESEDPWDIEGTQIQAAKELVARVKAGTDPVRNTKPKVHQTTHWNPPGRKKWGQSTGHRRRGRW